jgi:hypothetical protein
MTLNIGLAKNLLEKGYSVSVSGGQFVKATWFQRNISPFFSSKEAAKVIEFVKNKLKEEPAHEGLKAYGHLLVEKYKNIRSLRQELIDLDHRSTDRGAEYVMPENRKALAKWKEAQFNEAIFRTYTDFIQFCFRTPLFNQMKATNRWAPQEMNEDAAIRLEGKWQKFRDIKGQFEGRYAPLYNEKFLYKKDTMEVYTFTDTDEGLKPFHPYLFSNSGVSIAEETPYSHSIATLTEKEYQCIHAWSKLYPARESTKNEVRPHVLQLVTNYYQKSWFDFLRGPKHGYFRVIKPRPSIEGGGADVFEIGFVLRHRDWRRPLRSEPGFFRSPDTYATVPADKRFVTHIPMTQREAIDLKKHVFTHINKALQFGEPAEFNFWSQNCVCFLSAAVNKVLKIVVPTEAHFADIIRLHIIPELSPTISEIAVTIRGFMRKITPRFISYLVEKVQKIFNACIALVLTFVTRLLGAGEGKAGERFQTIRRTGSTLFERVPNWFDFSRFVFHIPGVMQNWQKNIGSTYIFDRSVKFDFVPLISAPVPANQS